MTTDRIWWVLGGLVAIGMIMLLVLVGPGFGKAGVPSPEAKIFKPNRPSINYEVFKPAILLVEKTYFVTDAVVQYFRPSNLSTVVCGVVPSRIERVPTALIRQAIQYCY